MMTLNEFQVKALKTAEYGDRGNNLVYPALGIAGESGEYVDKIKKLWRNLGREPKITDIPEEKYLDYIKELGDVLWYVSACAYELHTTLENVAEVNLAKLADRNARGVVKGEGDNR
jgi:NTP pyrophosphatase (non-canonical NTP hydrolase)